MQCYNEGNFFMVEESVRKAAAKKTMRKAVGRTATIRRAPRARAASVEAAPAAPRRKAPTLTITPRTADKRTGLYLGVGVFLFMFGISAAIGFTDEGAINVRGIIESRMASATPEERARLEQAQKATANSLPDGGLMASGVPEAAPPPIATTTASTTPAAASSTEAAASSTDQLVDGGLTPSDSAPE